MTVPLSAAAIPWDLRTPDPDQLRERLCGMLAPFELKPQAGRRYDARLWHRPAQRTAMTIIDYGAAVQIDADELDPFYLLQFLTAGSYRATVGGVETTIDVTRAHLIPPATRLKMTWSDDCRMIVIRLHKDLLAHYASSLLGGAETTAPERDRVLDLSRGDGRSLGHSLRYLSDELTLNGTAARHPALMAQVEDLFLSSLILARADPEADGGASSAWARPYYVLRAESFIDGHLHAAIGIRDIVAASGVSARTLYHGFHKTRGMGPLAWMRLRRLEAARQAFLAAPTAGVRVTDVALHWGFTHFGRFCGFYRQRFGETPSETLRRRPKNRP